MSLTAARAGWRVLVRHWGLPPSSCCKNLNSFAILSPHYSSTSVLQKKMPEVKGRSGGPFATTCSHYSTTPALRKKIPEAELSEKFVKGSGPGGQKINKVKNMVQLRHLPTGIMVQCQEARSLTANRSIARKLLERKVDHHLNGMDSSIGRSILKKQRRKQRGRRRAKKRLGATTREHDGDSDSAEEEDEEPVRIQLAGPSWATVGSNHGSNGASSGGIR